MDLMKRRDCKILCVQETKWKSDRARMLGDGYKLIHAGGDGKSDGVGVILESGVVASVPNREVEWQDFDGMVGDRQEENLCDVCLCPTGGKMPKGEKRVQRKNGSIVAIGGRRRSFVSDRIFQRTHWTTNSRRRGKRWQVRMG